MKRALAALPAQVLYLVISGYTLLSIVHGQHPPKARVLQTDAYTNG